MKPLLKWVGGKTQILEKVLDKFPTKINNYHEPFIGGGSVLLGVLDSKKIKIEGQINAYDLNENLITFYNCVKNKPNEFINEWNSLIEEYSLVPRENENVNRKPETLTEAKKCRENYYYWCRKQFNKFKLETEKLELAVYFLFLNKTCFRGLYRVGPNGFNVPYGHYKTIPKIGENQILEFSKTISNVNFLVSDFSNLVIENDDDFVYFDPPYVPENVNSFVGYQKGGFNLEQHNQLFTICRSLSCKFVLSNSDTDLVKDSFSEDGLFNVITIEARRAINSKNPNSKTNELIVYN